MSDWIVYFADELGNPVELLNLATDARLSIARIDYRFKEIDPPKEPAAIVHNTADTYDRELFRGTHAECVKRLGEMAEKLGAWS